MDFDSKDDYDNDGLLNTKEIDWNSPLIKDKSLKTYESLPTVQECIGYKKELTYVENGLKRLQTLPGNVYSELITKRILPINSDPLSIDGDGDGSTDDIDIYPLVYDQIPLEFRKMYFKGLISKEKIYNTDDGFYICMDSIENILKNMKCDITDEITDTDGNDVTIYQREYFDDQYFYAVKNSEDYAYSIVKLREIGDLNVIDVVTTYGVAVPFCEFDMDEFNYCNHNYDCNCDYATQSTIDSLHKVTVGDGECSKTLAYYFGDVKSEGSYLIGELYIQKLIDESFADSNTVELKQKPEFFWEGIFSISSFLMREEYFNPPESITISNKSNLSNEEKKMLIRYSLGSSSLNSFAAEIQAHAIFTSGADANSYELEKIKKEMALNPMINYGPQFVQVNLEDFITEEIIKHGIKADISYGEETFSAITVYLYLEDWSYYTQKQIEEHGIII